MPSRQPNGNSSPASSPATRIGFEPSEEASQSDTQNLILPPSPSPLLTQPEHRLEALHVQPLAVGPALEVLGERVEHVVGPEM